MLAMASGDNSKKPAPAPIQKASSVSPTPVKKPAAPERSPGAATAARNVPGKLPAKPVNAPVKKPSVPRPLPKASSQVAKRPQLSTPATSAPGTPDGIGKKKFSFKDIMQKAETLDKDKFRLQVKTKERKVEVPKQTKTAALLAAKSAKPPPKQPSPAQAPAKRPSSAAPIARPSAKLAQKLRRKSSAADVQEDDMDDFIDNDEEEEPSYRDEIWKMFNRGRSRSDFVDEFSDDDMEATGADVFAEEMRSARQARREDQEEEARLQRLAAEKAQRKARKGV